MGQLISWLFWGWVTLTGLTMFVTLLARIKAAEVEGKVKKHHHGGHGHHHEHDEHHGDHDHGHDHEHGGHHHAAKPAAKPTTGRSYEESWSDYFRSDD